MVYKLESTENVVKSVNEKIKKADDLIIKLDEVLSSYNDSNNKITSNKEQIEKMISEQNGFIESLKLAHTKQKDTFDSSMGYFTDISSKYVQDLRDEQNTLSEAMKKTQKEHEDFIERKISESYQETTKQLMEVQLELNKKYEKVYDHINKVFENINAMNKLNLDNHNCLLRKNKTNFLVVSLLITISILVNVFLLLI